jgi:hypothetical protein
VSDAEGKVAAALRARGRYVSGDAGSVLRELAVPTLAMIEAAEYELSDGKGKFMAALDAYLRAETRVEQPSAGWESHGADASRADPGGMEDYARGSSRDG